MWVAESGLAHWWVLHLWCQTRGLTLETSFAIICMLGDSNSVDNLRPPSVHMAKHRCVVPWSILCITRFRLMVEQVIFIMVICNSQYICIVWHSKTKQKTSEWIFSDESLVRYFTHTWLDPSLSSLVFLLSEWEHRSIKDRTFSSQQWTFPGVFHTRPRFGSLIWFTATQL